jgi:hypothetical protein
MRDALAKRDGIVSLTSRVRLFRPRWVAIVLSFLGLFLIAGAFLYATLSAWNTEQSAGLSCGYLPTDAPHSYIQYSIKEQAVEPYFRGSVFINLGELSSPTQADLLTTAAPTYGSTGTHVDFFSDDRNKTFWMRKESDEIPLVRKSGSAKDFPFDSAIVDVETTFNPPLQLRGLILRNFNPSF